MSEERTLALFYRTLINRIILIEFFGISAF
ncbi:Uncharacterised protein [Klebsiella pneumoniae]|nr:Uncharacterised protein [Klebsiella aerogenes]SWO74101.1 Uncharacterised protein [Klebsiella pneumoniae]SYJ18251.1 Uncharacterised protein [Klebsiella pneumoniae]SYT07928.1 Uncharacterised protein [Klebsiella pneumoniae]VTQ38139.1 Uncharacterised protein [Klebsiella pneumoniae]